jgi:uncharacterized cupredoxin-like copper-binding protein
MAKLCGLRLLAVKRVRLARIACLSAAEFAPRTPFVRCGGEALRRRVMAVAQPSRRISRAPLYVTLGFFAVALTLILIGAQRSADRAPAPAIASPGTPSTPRPVTVIMRDYLFDPRPIALVRGETVRFAIFDAGLLPHEFTLGDSDVQAAWDAADASATPPAPFTTSPPASAPRGTGGLHVVLSPGGQATVDFTVPLSGDVQLLCHLPDHIRLGMIGQIELRAAGSVGTP